MEVRGEFFHERVEVIRIVHEALEIPACTEKAPPSGEDYSANAGVAAAGDGDLEQFFRHLHAETVGSVGAVEGDAR